MARKQNDAPAGSANPAQPLTSGQLAEQDSEIARAQADERERDAARLRDIADSQERARTGSVEGNVRPEGDSGYRFPVLQDADLVDTSTKFPSAEGQSGDGGRASASGSTKNRTPVSENK